MKMTRVAYESPQLAALIGISPAIVEIRRLVDQLAASSASVLITGPSGSGKEVVAQLLHQRSARAARAFSAINCAAVPRDLLESELFGHEAGSFTGATRCRRGRFELADKGTLFLDEIGDMPAEFQVKLLRILETRIVERVGGMIGTPVDVRLIAATNVDLDAAIATGTFREDLYYRLAVVEMRLPPLAARREDIPLLIDHFARTFEAREVIFTKPAIDFLTKRHWRGNIRELRNVVARAAALYAGRTIDATLAEQLVENDRKPVDDWTSGAVCRSQVASVQSCTAPIDLKSLLDEVEQSYIESALGRTAGAIAESARLLGLRRTTLIEKMRRLHIPRGHYD